MKCKPGCTCGKHRAKPRGAEGRERSGGNSTEKALPPGALSRAEVNDLVSSVASLGACASALEKALDRLWNLCETINDRVSLVEVTPLARATPPSNATEDVPDGPKPTTEDEWWDAVVASDPPPKRQLSFYDGT